LQRARAAASASSFFCIAAFSILHDSKQLFASKYLTYLPTEQQLKEEIEKQKEIFRLQHIR
jgi:hypothetical protein